MAKKNEIYPSYFRTSDGRLIAITAPDKMYVVSPKGSNTGNPGVCLDHYITRKQVIRHYGCGTRITAEEFKTLYTKIYSRYLDHILNQKD